MQRSQIEQQRQKILLNKLNDLQIDYLNKQLKTILLIRFKKKLIPLSTSDGIKDYDLWGRIYQ